MVSRPNQLARKLPLGPSAPVPEQSGHGPLHQRPPGSTDETVRGVGQVTEALEWVERARGHIYEAEMKQGEQSQRS